MENHNADESNFETGMWKIYYLGSIFIASSVIQCLLLVNFECFKFLLNYWLLFGAYVTFMLLIILYIATDFAGHTLPKPLRWIIAVLIVELLNIALGTVVILVNPLVLCCTFAVVFICLVFVLAVGRTIRMSRFPVIVLIVFSSNILFIILISILMLVSKFLAEFFFEAFLIIAAICYPILAINTIYIAVLIRYDRYAFQSLTDSLKPSNFLHALFCAFVWFSLILAVEINKISESRS